MAGVLNGGNDYEETLASSFPGFGGIEVAFVVYPTKRLMDPEFLDQTR